MRTSFQMTALLVALASATEQAAAASQRSFDAIITESLEQVDRRSTEHADRSSKAEGALERLRGRIQSFESEFERTRDDTRRSELRALLTRDYAQYIATTARILDDAIEVVGKNLVDLQRAGEAMRRSGEAATAPDELRQRIERNVAVGKGMRRALEEIGRWARQDPALAGPMTRLYKAMRTFDRAITLDKARLGIEGADGGGAALVDRMTDALGDAYVALLLGRQELEPVREQVALAVRLGELELAKKAAERAMPGVFGFESVADDDRLLEVLKGVGRLNREALETMEGGSPRTPGRSGPRPVIPKADGFQNF
jgi:hypothetical protein